MQAVTSAQ